VAAFLPMVIKVLFLVHSLLTVYIQLSFKAICDTPPPTLVKS